MATNNLTQKAGTLKTRLVAQKTPPAFTAKNIVKKLTERRSARRAKKFSVILNPVKGNMDGDNFID